ncbi:SigE family RNA polymerase sigma factor [Nocardioides lijunqiniae]|uniref:SigE family RNA polymerase sigma factor n=1 Tax=Nocardioides lijunqiniae TaxID=2760832 RepID=UPI001878EFA4|nr:SigE family RNA polymerase sigma factor [Nocardioides lijunqiniae]
MSRREEFAELVTARSAALHRAAYLMVGDTALAQDLVQEALVKTYAAWPRLRDPANAEAYCRKAITTTAISWFQRRSWTHERPGILAEDLGGSGGPGGAGGTGGSVPGHADSVAQSEWLWQGLRRLPPRQRAAIVLRYYEDLTEAQTAHAMGCAVGTVKSQVAAGLSSLRAHLGDAANHLLPQTDTVVNR